VTINLHARNTAKP